MLILKVFKTGQAMNISRILKLGRLEQADYEWGQPGLRSETMSQWKGVLSILGQDITYLVCLVSCVQELPMLFSVIRCFRFRWSIIDGQ